MTKNGVTTQLGYDSDNPDVLTSYGNKAITYNANGGVSSYDGWDYTWTRGKLSSIRKSSGGSSRAIIAPVLLPSKTYSFAYNAFGQRVSKNYSYMLGTSGLTEVYTGMPIGYDKKFHYDHSGRLIAEDTVNQYYSEPSSSDHIVYLYDECGMIGLVYTASGATNTYYFQRNLLGDVIGIYDTSGNQVGGYAYDAYGNCTITLSTNSIASRNPIRYRGYYYDEDTKLYYLNSRYYSPEWRRFISPANVSAFNPQTVNGLNLYLYAGNNPINVQYNGSLVSTTSNAIGTIGFTSSISPLGISSPLSSFGWLGSMISDLSSAHGVLDKASSYLVGSLDGVLNYAGISKLNGFQSKLAKYSKWLLGIGIGLDIAASAYGNYHNSNLTVEQKWASFGADIGYIGVISALSYGAGTLVTKGSVALGSAAAGYAVGTTIGGVTIGYVGAIAIGATVVVVGVIAGTILITVVSDALDNWWDQKKEEWFS